MAKKLTLKNIMVYDFMRGCISTEHTNLSVKEIHRLNKDEIRKRFAITTYQAFNFHVRKVIDWRAETGSDINVIRMDNKGVL